MNITNSNLRSTFVQPTFEKPTRMRDMSNARDNVESGFYHQGKVSRHPSRGYLRCASPSSSSPSAIKSQRQESEEGGRRNPLSKYIQ